MDLNTKKITNHPPSPECQIKKMGLQYTNKGKMLRPKFNCSGIILQKKIRRDIANDNLTKLHRVLNLNRLNSFK